MLRERLNTTYRADNGVIWSIRIMDLEAPIDQDYTFDTERPGAVITWEGDDNDPFKRIVPSKCVFNMLLTSPLYDVDTQVALTEFYFDLVSSYEGRFFVEVKAGSDVKFVGKVLVDIGDLNLSFAQEIRITAIDTLTDLREIEFRPLDYNDTVPEGSIPKVSIKDLIIDILKRSDIAEQFWNDTDIFLQNCMNWREINQPSGTDPLAYALMRNHYYEQKSVVYRKYWSCFDALRDIMEGWNARCFYSNGMFRVEQFGAKKSPIPTYYRYNRLGGFIGISGATTTWDYDDNPNLVTQTFPAISWLPPFKAVELQQSRAFFNYISNANVRYDNLGPFDLGNVIANGQSKVIMQIEMIHLLTASSFPLGFISGNAPIEARFGIRCKIGDYYADAEMVRLQLTNTSNEGDLGPLITASFGLDSDNLIEFRFPIVGGIPFYPIYNKAIIYVETDTILADGEFSIEVVPLGYRNRFGSEIDPALITHEWYWTNNSRIILGTSSEDLFELPDVISVYEVGNLRNKIIYPLKFSFYDSYGPNLLKALFKNSVLGPIPTVEWIDGTAGTLPLQELVMKQVLGMRAKPLRKFKAQFYFKNANHLDYKDRIIYDTNLMLPLRMEIATGSGIANVTYFDIAEDYDDITRNDPPLAPPEIPQLPFPTADPEVFTPVGTPLQMYYEDWENVTASELIPDPDGFSINDFTTGLEDDEIRARFNVFVNGVRQRYIPHGSATLRQGQYNFGPTNDRVVFFRGLGGAYVEFQYIGYPFV